MTIQSQDWDEKKQLVKKSHPNHQIINLKLAQKQAELQKVILKLDESGNHFTVHTIREYFLEPDKPRQRANVFTFGEDLIRRLRVAGRFGNATVYEETLQKLSTFLGHRELYFDQITYAFLQAFEASMQQSGMKVNAISVRLRTLRAICNQAIKAGVTPEEQYPFKHFRIRQEKTINRALSREQIKRIEHLELSPGTAIWKYRQIFILSFNLIGISFIDLAMLRWSSIQQNRVVYKRMKTGKVYSILLTPKAREIIQGFQSSAEAPNKDHFILPVIPLKYLHDKEQQIKSAEYGYRHCNKYLAKIASLCGIEEKVTTYYARYTWANIARQLGYSKDLIAEALGHEYGNRVTGIYLDNYSNEVIDEANGRVTGE